MLSKSETNSSLSFLQHDYFLDGLAEGKAFGEILDMWQFNHEDEQNLLVTTESSSHVFKLRALSPNKLSLS